MNKGKKLVEVLAFLSFGVIVMLPMIIVAIISSQFGIDESIAVITAIFIQCIWYIVLLKFGGYIAKKIDRLYKTKGLTSTYEIKIKEET